MPWRIRAQELIPSPTEFFQVAVGNGVKLDGWMVKPPDFDPSKKYPVLVYIYGEPACDHGDRRVGRLQKAVSMP